MRHYQFRVNMSQDYELLSVAQDNPLLITYIREVHLRPAIEPHHKPLESLAAGPPEDTAYVLKLLNNKVSFGAQISSFFVVKVCHTVGNVKVNAG